MRIAALALTLCACVHGLPPGSPDAQDVSATEAAWVGAGLPGPGDCLELVEVRRHGAERAYVDACDGGRPGMYGAAARDSAGCLTVALRGVIGRRVWVVHVAPEFRHDPTIVGHELRHALTACHLTRPRSDPYDANHSDPRVWTTGR
jgi:hypothetical protein